MARDIETKQIAQIIDALPDGLKRKASAWLKTLPRNVALIDDELAEQIGTNTTHRIEEHAESLGQHVDNCDEWATILEAVFPGLYGERPVSKKSVMYYTDGSREKLKRYRKRAHRGNSVFNPGDNDGTKKVGESKAKAILHSPRKHQTQTRQQPPDRTPPRLLRELEEIARFTFGNTTPVPNVP